MIGTVGDLVEDIVVRLGGPVNEAADTDAVVVRRRGGSAANMAVSVARAGHPARFIGQIGDDAPGSTILDALRAEGVSTVVRRRGRTGTIVVLLDHHGERTMLTDRGACGDLADPDPTWLDGLTTLHVPVYSLVGGALATTTATLIGWAHERSITVSVDASSSSVIHDFGAGPLVALLHRLRPSVVFCNEQEAAALGESVAPEALGATITIIKHGGAPAVVLRPGASPVEVAPPGLDGVRDTTGAGDAFAAGFLIALTAGADPVGATAAGHRTAAAAITHASR